MKFTLIALMFLSIAAHAVMISETVYVESTTDTDGDGKLDRIYISINRPSVTEKLSSIMEMSPYWLGGTEVPMHNVDYEILPQDELLAQVKAWESGQVNVKRAWDFPKSPELTAFNYARIQADSVGTSRSTGCPTVGDEAEALGGKAVIDWLNGRAKGFNSSGAEVFATWSNGKVGMTGISYNGTLPIMVAATGVEGLEAIVPIAAISNWYDYYRANGLVVNPGGYIGEDADILGYYIARRGSCQAEMQMLTKIQGRENGDFTPFWQVRNHLANADKIKAATFIIHGQSDWNVKQKHAIQLWDAMKEGTTPIRMFLHKGGHGSSSSHQVPQKIQKWFDHFLNGDNNGITDGPQVEVELSNGELMVQNEWPSEATQVQRLYFNSDATLGTAARAAAKQVVVDAGKTRRMDSIIANPEQRNSERLVFLTAPLTRETVISGTPQVSLNLSVLNRRAANISVAIVAYSGGMFGGNKIITRGWVDPQNYNDITKGEVLVPGENYQVNFPLEPKQTKLAAGTRLGVVLTSTDYDYTLRPAAGTEVQFNLGENSFIDLGISSL